MPRWVVDQMACWKRRVGQNDIDIVSNVIHSFLMWCIWKKMNAQSYDDCERTTSDL